MNSALPQFNSSLPSVHSLRPLHLAVEGTHCPLLQVNWLAEQPSNEQKYGETFDLNLRPITIFFISYKCLPQLSSSLPSEHSLILLHLEATGTHWPFAQLNCVEVHPFDIWKLKWYQILLNSLSLITLQQQLNIICFRITTIWFITSIRTFITAITSSSWMNTLSIITGKFIGQTTFDKKY